MELNGWTSPQMLEWYGGSARGARARRSYDRIMTSRPGPQGARQLPGALAGAGDSGPAPGGSGSPAARSWWHGWCALREEEDHDRTAIRVQDA
jgi:hypothetical protein